MANWGEFLKEFKIKNLKSDGIWVCVDEVLDLYDERQRLRDEIAQLKQQQPQTGQGAESGQGEDVREQCARELEEVAAVASQDPDQPEYIATVLHAAAGLLRGGGVAQAETVEDSAADPALAEPVDMAQPAAEPLAPAEPLAADADEAASFLQAVEIPPPAEPVHPTEEHRS